MLLLNTFINNLINTLIRNLDMPLRIFISTIFILSTIVFVYLAIKLQPKDKPGLKIGYSILAVICVTLSVLYIIL